MSGVLILETGQGEKLFMSTYGAGAEARLRVLEQPSTFAHAGPKNKSQSNLSTSMPKARLSEYSSASKDPSLL